MNLSGDLRVDQIMPNLCQFWLQMPFEDCLISKGDYTKLKKSEIEQKGKIPVVDQGENLISGYINDFSKSYQGDLPIIIFGDHTRRFKYIDFDFAVGADGTKILCPFNQLDSKFFYFYLSCLHIESQGYSRHYRFLKQINVPIPPLNEQKRIVEKLEKVLAKVNDCQQRLERIPTILKRFRQSVLAAACSGRLTADWREKHPDIEPAEELLKRIQEERKRRYEEECKKAKAEGKRKPKAPFYNDQLIADEILLDLPSSWTLTYLGNITDTQGGIQKTPKRKPINHPYPYLRVANVYRGYLSLDEIEYFELFDEKELEKWKLKKGDLLIVEGNGSPTEIGRCAIWNEEIENCVHQNHIIRNRPLLDVKSKFILSYLNSPQGMRIMMQLSSSTSGLHTLSVSKINNIIVPLAPLEEQEEIVKRVEALFRKCDRIEERYQKAKAYTDKLTQSILAKAFRGELVPQDPNDEPAEVLLEKIKAEKAQQEQQTKAKKTRKKGVNKSNIKSN